MTIIEADETIAAYMNRQIVSKGYYRFLVNTIESTDLDAVYSRSLDALVPVWQKLGYTNVILSVYGDMLAEVDIYGTRINDLQEKGKTLQEAAAIVTAKAIKELNEN